jgi:hypothetical protein
MVNASLRVWVLSVALACIASKAAGADEQAQADACWKTLGYLALNKIDETVESILLEAQPWNAQEAKKHPNYEGNAATIREYVRRTYETVHEQNAAKSVRSRGPASRINFEGRIIHLEPWEFDNGRKIFVGCVRRSQALASAGLLTEMEFGPRRDEVLKRIQAKARPIAAK